MGRCQYASGGPGVSLALQCIESAMIVLFSLCLAISAAAVPAYAQTSATLTGSVADSSGGALPGVALTLRNTGTGLTRAATSTPDGRFVFAGIPAGVYDLRAELSGFRTVVRQGLSITVAQSLTLPLVMEVGGVEQAVTVSGGASAVNTATSELSFLVGEQAIETLPLNGRNFTDLALLQPVSRHQARRV